MEAVLTNKVALVTGGARGMGLAITELLGRCGARVALNDLDRDALDRAVGQLAERGITACAYAGNLGDEATVHRTFSALQQDLGRLDILVNNAGVLRPTRCEDITLDEWRFVLDNNLNNTFLCCRAAIPLLRAAGGGGIVNVSSSAGKSVSTIGGAHYTAAKAAVLGLTRHLARELARDEIRVNAVCPGLIDTEMVRSTISSSRVDEYAAGFPLRRLGLPREVAELVVFLASPLAGYITGASVDINGGDLTI